MNPATSVALDAIGIKTARQAPIGIFDSGIGGFSVLRHIEAQLPNESLFYFADTGFAPYGDKTEEEVVERALFAADYLLQQGVKALVVACNTATAVAITHLRSRYPDLILVGVEPGLKPAAALTKTGYIGVMATSRTLASPKYQALCHQLQQSYPVHFIHQACPGLADQIELGELESDTTATLLNAYLQPLFRKPTTPIDTLVLGCTHYPFVENPLRQIIARECRHPVQLVDTGVAIAQQLQRLLKQHQLLRPFQLNSLNSLNSLKTRPVHQFTTSGNIQQLESALGSLLQLPPDNYLLQSINPKTSCNLSAG